MKWGRKAIRTYLEEWADRRTKLREKEIEEIHPELKKRMDRLAPSYKAVAHGFLDKFKGIEMEPGEFKDILSWFLDALEKLLRVKDLLKNQGFTIAGARKRLSEAEPERERTEPERAEPDSGAKNMRRALLGLRQELMRMLDQIAEPKSR